MSPANSMTPQILNRPKMHIGTLKNMLAIKFPQISNNKSTNFLQQPHNGVHSDFWSMMNSWLEIKDKEIDIKRQLFDNKKKEGELVT